MSDRPALWFPLVLLAALAALTTWLDFQVRSGMTEAADRDRHDPDTILHNFSTRQTGKTGAVETIVYGQTLRRYMDDGSSDLVRPRVEHRDAKGVLLDIRSDRGRASGDQQTLDFEGHVTLHRSGKIKTPVSMETSALRVLPKKGLAMTDQPVRVTSAGTLVSGVGVDFDMNAQTVKIRSRVKVTYSPPKTHAASPPPSAPRRPERSAPRNTPRQSGRSG